MSTTAENPGPRAVHVIGRYAVYDEIAAGGMATVHLGRLLGPVGFTRTVAVKRLHANLAKDPEFTAMFLDEARLAARIRHPNVVQTLDVVARQGELFLVMDYVHGESLAMLIHLAGQNGGLVPLGIVGNLISGTLQGLHAAHEARSDRGEPLGIVHRDISPQNVLVGVDGIPRLLDFGIAKALGRAANTRGAQLKGKIAYMSPEQIIGNPVSRQTDVWGVSIVLWQALTGRKLFHAPNDAETLFRILEAKLEPPSRYNRKVSAQLDAVVMRGLEREPEERFATAHDMVLALEKAMPVVSQREVVEWVEKTGGEQLVERARRIAEIESMSTDVTAPLSDPPPRPPRPEPVIVSTPSGQRSSANLESAYMTGMADTLPPPAERSSARKRLAVIVAALVAMAGIVTAVIAWRWSSVAERAPGAPPLSVAAPSALSASPPPSAVTASAMPEAPPSAVPAASGSVAASAASKPPGKPGATRIRPSGTGTKPPGSKPGSGIYARE